MLQNGDTALHSAALGGHAEVVKMLVKYGAAVDIRNKVIRLADYQMTNKWHHIH